MNAQPARDDDTAPVTLAPRRPACKSGCVVDLGGAHAGIRCMVERNGRRGRSAREAASSPGRTSRLATSATPKR